MQKNRACLQLTTRRKWKPFYEGSFHFPLIFLSALPWKLKIRLSGSYIQLPITDKFPGLVQRTLFLGFPNNTVSIQQSTCQHPWTTQTFSINTASAGCRQSFIKHTLRRRAELGLVHKCRQIRGLWIILLIRVQVHGHAGPFLAGHWRCQLLLICRMNHCGYDGRCFWSRQWSGILQKTSAN